MVRTQTNTRNCGRVGGKQWNLKRFKVSVTYLQTWEIIVSNNKKKISLSSLKKNKPNQKLTERVVVGAFNKMRRLDVLVESFQLSLKNLLFSWHLWPYTGKRTILAFCFQTAFRLQAVCQPFNQLGHLFARNARLFEQLRHPFVGNINLFEQLSCPFVRNIKLFEWLGHPFVEDIRPFEWLRHAFIEDIRPFERLGHTYYSIPLNFLLNDMEDKLCRISLVRTVNSMFSTFVRLHLHTFYISFKLLFHPFKTTLVHKQLWYMSFLALAIPNRMKNQS